MEIVIGVLNPTGDKLLEFQVNPKWAVSKMIPGFATKLTGNSANDYELLHVPSGTVLNRGETLSNNLRSLGLDLRCSEDNRKFKLIHRTKNDNGHTILVVESEIVALVESARRQNISTGVAGVCLAILTGLITNWASTERLSDWSAILLAVAGTGLFLSVPTLFQAQKSVSKKLNEIINRLRGAS